MKIRRRIKPGDAWGILSGDAEKPGTAHRGSRIHPKRLLKSSFMQPGTVRSSEQTASVPELTFREDKPEQ